MLKSNASFTNFIKVVTFMPLFLLFHFSYEKFPSPIIALFSATDESFVQHAKIGFFAYTILCGLEYIWMCEQISHRSSFFFSRLLSTLILPWAMFILWYPVPQFYGQLPLFLEIMYATIVTLLMTAVVGVLEREFEKIDFSKSAKGWMLGMYLTLAMLFISFSFGLPWADFFRAA
jgi:hypothetical protein